MTAKHTPAPWNVIYDAGTFGESIGVEMGSRLYDPSCYESHHLWECNYDSEMPDYEAADGEVEQYEEAIANARLIAAAPDMLEILERTLDALESGKREVDIWAIRSVIAKARGES